MPEAKRYANFVPDHSGNTRGYLFLREEGIREGEVTHPVRQIEYKRVLDYDSQGKLLGIRFIDPNSLNPDKLPQDEVIPSSNLIYALAGVDYEDVTAINSLRGTK